MEKLKTMEEKLIKGGCVCTYCISFSLSAVLLLMMMMTLMIMILMLCAGGEVISKASKQEAALRQGRRRA